MVLGTCLCVRNLRKLYKNGQVVANDGITLDIAEGEIFGLLGPNGAGKTTFIRQVTGLLSPTSGEITLLGVDVVRSPDRVKPLIGYMAQRPFGLWQLTVQEAIEFTGRLRGVGKARARVQAGALVEELGLAEHRKKILMWLSLGLLKAVCFGMAVAGSPRLIFLDEPTESLDPARRRVMWERVVRMNAEEGVTFVLVTHNIAEAERVLGRVAIVGGGRILALGTPAELKRGIDDRLRVEMVSRDGCRLSDKALAALGELGHLTVMRNGSVALLIAPADLSKVIEEIRRLIGFENLDDFRLAGVTLEDVYMKIGGGKID